MTPAALAYLLQVLQLAPQMIGVFGSLTGMIGTGKDPTPEDMANLDKLRDDLHRQVQA